MSFNPTRTREQNSQHAFESWLDKVNGHVQAKVGLSYDDLPDQPYRNWFDSGVSPRSAAARAIRGAAE